LFPPPPVEPARIAEYRLDPSRKDEKAKEYQGALADVFFGPKDRLVDKWLHYLAIYEHHFAQYRGKPLTFLEIGVFKGGSLEMWRQYLGTDASIWGVDIDPACSKYETPGTRIRIGSQADPAFLNKVVDEMGAPDLILDDGSHIAEHQVASFNILFPRLKDGGLYVIEDLHTSFWTDWGGGYRKPGTAIELVKTMIDDLHGWYHHRPTTTPAQHEVGAIHVYDSLVVIEKKRRGPPAYIRVAGRLSASTDLTEDKP
jgi:hypothetical protein